MAARTCSPLGLQLRAGWHRNLGSTQSTAAAVPKMLGSRSVSCSTVHNARGLAQRQAAAPAYASLKRATSHPTRSAVLRLGAILGGNALLGAVYGAGPAAGRSGSLSTVVAAAMSTDAAAASGAGATPGGHAPTGAIVVYVTVPSMEVGEGLASKLVEAKLAACVNILPGVTSVYWWDGKVNKDPELLLIIKTREELLGQLTSFVKTHHPYDEPEVVALPILGGSPSYLQWLMSSTKGAVAEGQ